MATLSMNRASYQRHDNITTKREPFAGPQQQARIVEMQRQLSLLSSSTTQAAYLLRLDSVRRLSKLL